MKKPEREKESEAQLVETVTEMLRRMGLGEVPAEGVTKRILAAARPLMAREEREKVLRELHGAERIMDQSACAEIEYAISNYIETYASEHNIDLTSQEGEQ